MKLWGLMWLLLATAVAPRSARADQSSREQAARAFAAGDQAFAAGQNLAAARAYETAYALEPLPEITFSTAQAYRRHYFEDPDVRWLEKAQALYRQYLKDEPTGGRRAHAVTHLSNIAVLLSERANEERSVTEPQAAPTEFLVSSTTPGALASIDGGAPRAVPLVQKVTAGPHDVTVTAPGYFDSKREIVAVEGRMMIVPSDLEARPGKLVVVTSKGAEVWVDGRNVGQRAAAEGIAIPAGNHRVSVAAAGRQTVSRSVRIDRGETESLRVELETSSQRIASYWLFGISGGLAAGGVVSAIVSAVSESQAIDARAGFEQGHALTPEQARESNSALRDRDLARGFALGAFSAGALTGLAGTLVLVIDRPDANPSGEHAGNAFGAAMVGSF